MKLLSLSNGHGEDAIAVRILAQLQNQAPAVELAALPVVGRGNAYVQQGIELAGPAKNMPSGGFIYMDGRQLARDLRGGLLQLTLAQWKTVRTWAKQGGTILAVGDIVPLLFAWLSGAPYAFVGTAKSDYYLRDESGPLPRKSWRQRLEGWGGSVYLPWEQWLMRRRRCAAVFPRDRITTERLQQVGIRAFDLGNPMMDDLEADRELPLSPNSNQDELPPLAIALLPGSRIPEALENWQQILAAVGGLLFEFSERPLVFLAAIAPGLVTAPFRDQLIAHRWQPAPESEDAGQADRDTAEEKSPVRLQFTQAQATLWLTQQDFNACLQQADIAIAMAGTATEQFVGLGKPAFILPGKGPQFTPAFAEAQTRLLGPSVTLVPRPDRTATEIRRLLRDPDRLQLIADNGKRRMGDPGAAQRIAACLLDKLLGLTHLAEVNASEDPPGYRPPPYQGG